MALPTLFYELIDIIIMSACIGYIFFRYFARFNVFRKHYHEGFYHIPRFNWSDFMFSIYLIAPAIILHELGHKIIAMSFGYSATFFSAISINKLVNGAAYGYSFLDFPAILMIIAIVSTYLGGTFLFFVPAYVAFSAAASPSQLMLIAFAGPFVNLLLWLIPKYLLKSRKIPYRYFPLAVLTSKINMLLFIFNMIPFPGFDGYKVFAGLFSLIF